MFVIQREKGIEIIGMLGKVGILCKNGIFVKKCGSY
jgi:hypothetical protein